jgi:hypothetical protein
LSVLTGPGDNAADRPRTVPGDTTPDMPSLTYAELAEAEELILSIGLRNYYRVMSPAAHPERIFLNGGDDREVENKPCCDLL